MNRRDFLQRLGLGAATVALSPMLDLAEILPAPSVVVEGDYLYAVAQIKWMVNTTVHNPRRLGILTGICE